jgi:hypothetical protein
MSNIIAFPVRFGASDRDRIMVFRRLKTEPDGGQHVDFAVWHVDQQGRPISRLWEGASYREAMTAAEAASAGRRALIEIDIRQVRS